MEAGFWNGRRVLLTGLAVIDRLATIATVPSREAAVPA